MNLASAFIINYNWAHSGLWSIMKWVSMRFFLSNCSSPHRHLLPASAIAKVAFPSMEELGTFIPEDILSLGDYFIWPFYHHFYSRRAVLDALKTPPIPEKLETVNLEKASSSRTPSPSASSVSSLTHVGTEVNPTRTTPKRKRKPSSRFSVDNPFYGYPLEVVEDDARGRSTGAYGETGEMFVGGNGSSAQHTSRRSQNGVPRLRHGRRRKRDLAKTLLMLYWQQWKAQISIGAILVVAFGLFRLTRLLKRGKVPGLSLLGDKISKLLLRS